MPVHPVGGKWQYGKTGKKYRRRADAVVQGQAIRLSQEEERKKKRNQS